MGKYDYLKQYVGCKPESSTNCFFIITKETIQESERKIGFEFPCVLKEFWLEIGGGMLDIGIDKVKGDFTNLFLSPCMIVSTLLNDEETMMLFDVREDLPEHFIPFFEVCDSSDFFYMRMDTDTPEAVYEITGRMLEPSLERFVWHLYHESPNYFVEKRLSYRNS